MSAVRIGVARVFHRRDQSSLRLAIYLTMYPPVFHTATWCSSFGAVSVGDHMTWQLTSAGRAALAASKG